MTECNQSSFGFKACGRRDDCGPVSTVERSVPMSGARFLLLQTDQRLNLSESSGGMFFWTAGIRSRWNTALRRCFHRGSTVSHWDMKT